MGDDRWIQRHWEEWKLKGFQKGFIDDKLLIRALRRESITEPTPIQTAAIPLIKYGRDVVVRARAGSGKTLAYMISIIQERLVEDKPLGLMPVTIAIIIAPTNSSCHKISERLRSLIKLSKVKAIVTQLESGMSAGELRKSLRRIPDVLVSTPDSVARCLDYGFRSFSVRSLFIVDEIDRLLSSNYGSALVSLMHFTKNWFHFLLFSDDPSFDVERLKDLVRKNPYVVTLRKGEDVKVQILPYNAKQHYIRCDESEKLCITIALLRHVCTGEKVLVFTDSDDTSKRLQYCIERLTSYRTLLDAELLDNSRLRIEIDDKDLGVCLIATYGNQAVPKLIDFENVDTVINCDMPRGIDEYAHRTDRTKTTNSTGVSFFLVSPKEVGFLELIQTHLGRHHPIVIPQYWGEKSMKIRSRAVVEEVDRIMKMSVEEMECEREAIRKRMARIVKWKD